MALHQLLRRDRRVKKLRRLLNNGSFSVSTIEFIRELEMLHTTRLSRSLTVQDVTQRFQGRFMKSVLQNQATRSRAVAIRMTCFRAKAMLQRHINNLVKYLMATYSEQLRHAATTKGERENIVHSVLGNADQLLEELTTTMALADMLIGDLDANSRTNYGIVEVMKLIQERGRQY